MRISSKGRYGIAAMITMAKKYTSGELITIISIAEKLGISKIYLEQVFSLLKRAKLVSSIKGAQGGYQLCNSPDKISAFQILSAIEQSLFEKTEGTVSENAKNIEQAMQALIFNPLDEAVKSALEKTSLADLVEASEKESDGYMFFI